MLMPIPVVQLLKQGWNSPSFTMTVKSPFKFSSVILDNVSSSATLGQTYIFSITLFLYCYTTIMKNSKVNGNHEIALKNDVGIFFHPPRFEAQSPGP